MARLPRQHLTGHSWTRCSVTPKAMPISPSVVAHTLRGASTATSSWQPLVFLWPQQADEAMRTINAALSEPGLNDVYVCPNILKTDKRNKDTAVTHRLLHSDADHGLDSSKVAALNGFAVGSGSPGHAHVYVPLARGVTLAEYQVLMRGMRDYFGGDDKISDNDLLRPVGSVNYKAVVLDGQGQPYRVEWIVKPSSNA